MNNTISNNLTDITDDDCSLVDGGMTCTQFVIGMSTIGGMAVGTAVAGVGMGIGGFAGGLVGIGLADLLCP